MSDLEVVAVHSNLDALDEGHLHDALVGTVRDAVHEMRLYAVASAPKRSGLLAEHIDEDKVEEIAEMIHGKLGVKAVEEADDRPSYGRYRRSQYPLFVEGGTRSPIFPAKSAEMWNIAEGIWGRRQVRGQRPQQFMFATFLQARALLHGDPQISLALKEMDAVAAAEKAAIEAER